MVRVEYAIKDNFYRLYVHGHAGYAEKGKDIVCAGVSALVRALQIFLEAYLAYQDADYIEKLMGEDNVYFGVGGINEDTLGFATHVAFNICLDGLRAIEEQYPDYIKLYDISFPTGKSDIDTPEQTESDKEKEEKE